MPGWFPTWLPPIGRGAELLWMAGMLPLSALFHELGHAVAGRLAGMSVYACGVGAGRPVLRVALGGLVLFLGKMPYAGGFTLAAGPGLRAPPSALVAFALGGPLANVLTALAALGIDALGGRSAAVSALFWIAGLNALFNLVPYRARVGGLLLRNDAMVAIGAGRGTSARDTSLGPQLRMLSAMRRLLEQLRSPAGAARFTVAEAGTRVEAMDDEGALALLASVPGDAHPETLGLAAIARAIASTGRVGPEGAVDEVARAEAAVAPWPEGQAVLALGLLARAISAQLGGDRSASDDARLDAEPSAVPGGNGPGAVRRSQSGREWADATRALELSRRSGRVELIAEAEVWALAASRPPELGARASALLAARGDVLSPSTVLALSGVCARVLAERADVLAARPWYTRGVKVLRALEAAIPERETRARFFTRAGRDLHVAGHLLGEAPLEPIRAAEREELETPHARIGGILGLACAVITVLAVGDVAILRGVWAIEALILAWTLAAMGIVAGALGLRYKAMRVRSSVVILFNLALLIIPILAPPFRLR